jgi:hypothetical protein
MYSQPYGAGAGYQPPPSYAPPATYGGARQDDDRFGGKASKDSVLAVSR